MEDNNSSQSVYKNIIWGYIDSINSQIEIVPFSYRFLGAQMLAEGKKVKDYAQEHGTPFIENGEEGVRMSLEHSAVFEKQIKFLNNAVSAFDMIGVNAVIGMVCKYDGYLGILTKQVFADKPELFNCSEKEFKASDIFSFKDLDELKSVLIEKEIETLLRKNHVDQLQWLESKLSIELRKFKSFPAFVEIMERRNLFVHANGVVSRQYLSECKKYNATIPKEVAVGSKLESPYEYARKAYEVLFHTGVMLGFVLWHKIRPQEATEMIDRLSEVAYDLINNGEYDLALEIIDSALANKSWAKEIKAAQQIVFRVNKALAFHLRNMQTECDRIVESIDVSAAEPKYHLAIAVLKKDYTGAYQIMGKIGADEEMRLNYKIWPLFKKIRKEVDFSEKYKEIYNEEYECCDTKRADFEEVINSASELVEKNKQMMHKNAKTDGQNEKKR